MPEWQAAQTARAFWGSAARVGPAPGGLHFGAHDTRIAVGSAPLQAALGYDTAQERAVHASQNEGKKGYGGKFGVQQATDTVRGQPAGWELGWQLWGLGKQNMPRAPPLHGC